MNTPARTTSRLLQNVASLAGLALLVAVAAGSAPSSGSEKEKASQTTTTAADNAATEPKVGASGKTLPNYEYIRATCNTVKDQGQCTEYYGTIPPEAEKECKSWGGTFTLSTPKPSPCPTANLIGACHVEQQMAGRTGYLTNYYVSERNNAATEKKLCVMGSGAQNHEWIEPPASAAAPASAAKPAPKAAAAKPAAPSAAKAKK